MVDIEDGVCSFFVRSPMRGAPKVLFSCAPRKRGASFFVNMEIDSLCRSSILVAMGHGLGLDE